MFARWRILSSWVAYDKSPPILINKHDNYMQKINDDVS